ncbi:MAG TPA: NAD(P)-binding domain-containing protein [Vicinamibacterales bacterium]|jgi:FAD-dependent urate hydroxylase|nr:NAD(P)-binding domain-containing protein [Vicinamibacterales bacterium]
MDHTELLIVGAGPYGLAAGAYAKSAGVDVTVVGRPLDLWKTGMPRGMFLRSGPDWHLDAREVATFEAYVNERRLTGDETKPMRLETFLDYVGWFMGQYNLAPQNKYVTHLARSRGGYLATMDDGSRLFADSVLLALGFAFFKHYPRDIVEKLPPRSYSHTSDTVDFDFYRNKRVLIVGGRQSAYEWAALIREHGSEQVHLTHRHAQPRFIEPDWSWVQPMVRQTLIDHGWWRELAAEEQQRIRDAFWATGRLVLEAWLDRRVHQPNIHVHANTNVASVDQQRDGTYDVALDDGSHCNVHSIILATGYRPIMDKVGFLDRATILDSLATVNGFPALDPDFQTSLPHLYVTGLAATQDFGPFFGFTVGCPVAAKIIGDAVVESHVYPLVC